MNITLFNSVTFFSPSTLPFFLFTFLHPCLHYIAEHAVSEPAGHRQRPLETGPTAGRRLAATPGLAAPGDGHGGVHSGPGQADHGRRRLTWPPWPDAGDGLVARGKNKGTVSIAVA
jgi:hypothetical protein